MSNREDKLAMARRLIGIGYSTRHILGVLRQHHGQAVSNSTLAKLRQEVMGSPFTFEEAAAVRISDDPPVASPVPLATVTPNTSETLDPGDTTALIIALRLMAVAGAFGLGVVVGMLLG